MSQNSYIVIIENQPLSAAINDFTQKPLGQNWDTHNVNTLIINDIHLDKWDILLSQKWDNLLSYLSHRILLTVRHITLRMSQMCPSLEGVYQTVYQRVTSSSTVVFWDTSDKYKND
jgi:hypothetical protein